MPGFDNNTVYAGNIDFSGAAVVTPQMVTDGQLLIGATGLNPAVATLASGDGSTTITNGAGTIGLTVTQATTAQLGGSELATDTEVQTGTDTQRIVTPSGLNALMSDSMFSGRLEWSGAGAYYSLAATNFTLLRGGTGYIKSKLITWSGSQSTGALSTGNTHYIYIDDTGTIGTATTRNLALFQDNIVLFEALVDPNSVVSVVREDHPYDFPSAVSEWAHDTVGTVIANITQGANISLNGTKAIQIDGADELEDHGLETDIPDSGAAAVDFTFMFTNGAGKWTIDSTANTFASEYNNAGAVAALGANKYGIFRIYVSKDDLNTSTPVYYAVLDDAQYNNLTAANTAIALNTPARQSNELAQIELAQLGFVVKEESSDTIVNVVIEKDVGGGSTSLASPGVASLTTTDTTNFDGWLTAADTTVQAALDTLDDTGGKTSSFLAYLSATAANATGAGTKVDPIIFNTAPINVGSDYNTGTGIFTAPVDGAYQFSATIWVTTLTAAMTSIEFLLETSNRVYYFPRNSPGATRDANTLCIYNGSTLADMEAGDTAKITVNIANGAGDTADIFGGGGYTYFSGFLVA